MNDNLLVNVFRWDEVSELTHPIRFPTGKHEPRALLILVDETKGHYVVVKSMQRLFRKQTGRCGKRFYCNNCLLDFSSNETLQKHVVCCEKLDHPSQGIAPKKVKPKRLDVVLKPKNDLKNKGVLINMKCPNEESFKWAVTRALNPTINGSGRVTKILIQQSNQYNWDGISFPTPLEQIKNFEKNNGLLINIFKVDECGDVQILRIPTGKHTEPRVLLIVIDGRYAVVKTFSRLISRQTTIGKRKCKRFHCYNCLENFVNKDKFDEHMLQCYIK